MNKPSETLGLRSPDGREAQLLSVQVHGEVLGLMLRLTVRQTWRNTSGAPMATRLTLALPPEQSLLELKAERSSGEQAITTLSRTRRDTCTAGFGVMNTGEQVTLQWRIGQLLHLQGGSLRLQLPAALVPPALRTARLSFEIHDPVARGTLGSTSHEMQRVRHANGMTLNLQAAHGLDKDFSLTVHGLRDTGFAVASPDLSMPGQCTMLASHSVQWGTPPAPQRLRLKLVVDHTGAIGAERQQQIHSALERLLGQLESGDQLSCSRMGASLVHDLPRLQPCTEAYVRRARALMRHTEVESGEPDWSAVMQTLLDIRDEDEEAVSDANILLVTAQPLPASAALAQTLRAAGHRLHVLAVGAAASDSLWPVLAQASDGSCETLIPGQHSQQTLQRLLDRMRQQHPVQAQLSVQGQALAATHHEHDCMTEGDTLHLWGAVELPATEADLTGRPQWQARLQWHTSDGTTAPMTADTLPVLWDAQGDLSRLCAIRQALRMDNEAERQTLIERHQIVWPDERSLVTATAPVVKALPRPTEASVAARPVASTSSVHALRAASPATAPAASASPVEVLVHRFNQKAPAYSQFRAALSATLHLVPTRTIDGLVMQLARQAGNPARVWALLLHWLHAEHELSLQAHALQLVEQELQSVPAALRKDIHVLLAASVLTQPMRQAA